MFGFAHMWALSLFLAVKLAGLLKMAGGIWRTLFIFCLKWILRFLVLSFINSSSVWMQNWFAVSLLLFTKGESSFIFFILPCPVPFASEKRAASYLDREV